MPHSFAKRFQDDEEHIRAILESALLQYSVLLGVLMLLAVCGFFILYFGP
ncbi:MAG: hypothetical protein M1541_03125 [Acidobacteria bacterium]|nr:hypothetical protein [Acidobacteriota bacterium]